MLTPCSKYWWNPTLISISKLSIAGAHLREGRRGMNPCPPKALLNCALQFSPKMPSKCSKMCQICPHNTSEMAQTGVFEA